jgi:hypothetical protein
VKALEDRSAVEVGVLATMLYDPTAYTKLPVGITEYWFEAPELQSLFREIRLLCPHEPTNVDVLIKTYPDTEGFVRSVKDPNWRLDGKFSYYAESLRPGLELGPPSTGSRTTGPFRFIMHSGSEMQIMRLPQAADLIVGILRAKSVAFLSGEEGAGKSLLAMNLGLAIASRAEGFLNWKLDNHGPVLFLNNEYYFEEYCRRFQQMSTRLPGRAGLDNFIAPEAVPPLADCWQSLTEYCAQYRPGLVILDCLYFAHNEDENDSSKMKALMRQFQMLRDEYNLCLLVFHHLKKGARD